MCVGVKTEQWDVKEEGNCPYNIYKKKMLMKKKQLDLCILKN